MTRTRYLPRWCSTLVWRAHSHWMGCLVKRIRTPTQAPVARSRHQDLLPQTPLM